MKKLLLILFLFSTTICFGQDLETTTFFLIRHAEKTNDGTKDPPLTAEGEARAESWAYLIELASRNFFYSTNYKRTQSTAQAIANANNLTSIISYDPMNFDLEKFLNKVKGKTVVVVGHSNTIPSLANTLINEERFQQIEESNYTKLFIVHYTTKDIANAVLLTIE